MADGIGVRVWFYGGTDETMATFWSEHPMRGLRLGYPYLAIPLDAESLAGLRERVCKALNDILDDEDAVDATFAAFAALGLSEVIAP